MKNIFNALVRPFAARQTFTYGEGNRTAIVKSRRILFGQKITSEFKNDGPSVSITSSETNISVGFGLKKKLKQQKQAAQDFCKKGL